ncbi:unnamed protein product [Adineta ricciae]|uniref:Uncharacterized protein n=1 Tax=Adineta ricciae TaxID=249248 RepID=A0A815IN04_ADIRI|nr:unnamed protein product [Adineta ricciae]CAF1370705.1 unnamed protein product [Adineta ricciae]
MLSSPLQTSASTMIDDRVLRAYLQQNSTWSLNESGHMDHYSLSSSGNGDKFLNNSVHFPTEMRSANLNQIVSNIVEESSEHQPHGILSTFILQKDDQHMYRAKNSSFVSGSGSLRNIPDNYPFQHYSPKDVQVLLRKGDNHSVNSLVQNIPLQKFRQMIGLQPSSGSLSLHERINRNNNDCTNLNQQFLPLSSSSSSLPTFNQQQNYSRQQSSMANLYLDDTISMNDVNLPSSITSNQEMNYYRSNRRTGVTNTLHIAIEKCSEQLNYIRDSYAETESKIGIQILHKTSSSATDVTNTTVLNNPSRVDRLIAEYYYEYNRIIRLHERIKENISLQDSEATRQTLDEWFTAINTVRDRRRQEINNATEKFRIAEARLSDEKNILQLAESLRVLRITTRKIRTILWCWLYWSTNNIDNKITLVARHESQFNHLFSTTFDVFKSDSIISNANCKENQCNK